MRILTVWLAAVAAIVVLCTAGTAAGGATTPASAATHSAAASAAATRSAAAEAGVGARPAGCSTAGVPDEAGCFLSFAPAPGSGRGRANTTTCTVNEAAGYTPCNLQAAYGLTSLASTAVGTTVAVVDPNDDPNAAADLAVYRSTYGLPACTVANKCFRKLSQVGKAKPLPAPNSGDASEIALDIEMVSAACPNCHILLVEANSNGFSDLLAAESEALKLGAKVISNSWGTGEFDGETSFDSSLDHPGVPITFSSGDGSYQGGVQYPSASPFVTSVGGTELTPAGNSRGFTESAWVTTGSTPPTQGSGSGCSAYEGKPAWQTDTGCATRMTADISAVAADVLSYDTYDSGGSWFFSFGTSVSSPFIAGMYGLAANAKSITTPASVVYTAAAANRLDITTGSEGTCSPVYFCQAVAGYDGPTGVGSPIGIGELTVAKTKAVKVTSVAETGTGAHPTITVHGTNFGQFPPPGAPETCNAGDTGDVFGSVGLSFADTTNGWTAGQSGDCIGITLTSWTPTTVVFGFGNQYANYPAAAVGNAYALELQGTVLTGSLIA